MRKPAQSPVAERAGLDVVVAEALRERILSASLPPDSHLVESEFAKELGVAHGTIRSAFKLLQMEGLVEYRPRRGMFVATTTPEDILELCSLRDALEALAAGLAATNATKSDQVALRNILRAMQGAASSSDPRLMIQLDLDFHVHVVDMSRHRRLAQIYSTLASQVKLFMTLTGPLHTDLGEMVEAHQALAQPILAGDASTASRLASTHNQADGQALAAQLRDAQRMVRKRW